MKNFVLIFFCFFCVSNNLKSELVNKIVAVVNSEVILQSDIESLKNNLGDYYFPRFSETSMDQNLKNDKWVVDVLIDNILIEEAVKEFGLKVSDVMLDKEINSLLKQNNTTKENLVKSLNAKGISFEEFRESRRKEIERFNFINQEIKPRISINESDLKNYYQKKTSNQSKSYEYDLYDFISNNQNLLEKLRKELNRSGITEKTKKLCDTNCNLVDLGYIDKNSLSPQFLSAIEKLKEGEKVTQVVFYNKVKHLLYIKSMRLKGSGSFDEIKNEISNEYFNVALENELKAYLADSRKRAFIDIKVK